MKVFKYSLGVTDVQRVDMPKNAQILTIQTQRGCPCVWALVDEKAPMEAREFLTIGSGQPVTVTPRDTYIGTYQLNNSALVFHVFESVK